MLNSLFPILAAVLSIFSAEAQTFRAPGLRGTASPRSGSAAAQGPRQNAAPALLGPLSVPLKALPGIRPAPAPGSEEGPGPGAVSWEASFLDRQLMIAESAVTGKKMSVEAALGALEAISWSRPQMRPEQYEAWRASREGRLTELDRSVADALRKNLEKTAAEGDSASVRERLRELRTWHEDWARRHSGMLEDLAAGLPEEGTKAEPIAPDENPEVLAERMRDHLSAGEYRQAEYLLMLLETRHREWSAERADERALLHKAIFDGTMEAFARKQLDSNPIEARRMSEFAQALAKRRNVGYGYREPVKQDTQCPLCTVYSLYYGFQATIGFSDPSMTPERFADFVRATLKDPTIGVSRGMSTHRIRTFLKALGYKVRVVEMQERLKTQFGEGDLLALFKPGQVLIGALTIVQRYPDEPEPLREEHKIFLRDAYFNQTEKRWVFVAMDTLLGRTSFYSWPELKALLHKVYVVEVGKPF